MSYENLHDFVKALEAKQELIRIPVAKERMAVRRCSLKRSRVLPSPC
jgi:hypothetical protein